MYKYYIYQREGKVVMVWINLYYPCSIGPDTQYSITVLLKKAGLCHVACFGISGFKFIKGGDFEYV